MRNKVGYNTKFLEGKCRTFCLNYPGKIYRYPYGSFDIPGGVIAGTDCTTSNVGILYRHADKEGLLDRLSKASTDVLAGYEAGVIENDGVLSNSMSLLNRLYGNEIATGLLAFSLKLGEHGLINWNLPHIVHLPLLDWYWPVFGRSDSFNVGDGLYVVGDVAGHARGLLQASTSGWLAAEEYLECK